MNENIQNDTPRRILILCRGLPGSGKSTLAQSLKVDVVREADQYFMNDGVYKFDKSKLTEAHQWCELEVRKAMQLNKQIAVANTFTTMAEMLPYFELAENYGYMVFTLVMENRHGSASVHDVPFESIARMQERFELQLTRDTYSDFVKVKKYDNGLEIHKYNRKVFFGNLWDKHPKLIDARGTVYDNQGNLVQYPFTKIFNWKENGTTIDTTHRVLAVDKINGFMAAVTWHNDQILVSTTGSLDSDFVGYAKEMLPLDKMEESLQYFPNYTFTFEIVHPDDPHIIEENVGAYLIGARLKSLGSEQMEQENLDHLADEWGVYRPQYFTTTFGELLALYKNYKREGYVVYDLESSTVLKLKTPYYLVSKFIARTKKLEIVFDKNYKQRFDEEFYTMCEWIQQTFTKHQFSEIPEQQRLDIIRGYFNETA